MHRICLSSDLTNYIIWGADEHWLRNEPDSFMTHRTCWIMPAKGERKRIVIYASRVSFCRHSALFLLQIYFADVWTLRNRDRMICVALGM